MTTIADAGQSTKGSGATGVRAEHPETPDEFQKLHSVLVKVSIFFLIYLLVEGVVLLPLLVILYGWQS